MEPNDPELLRLRKLSDEGKLIGRERGAYLYMERYARVEANPKERERLQTLRVSRPLGPQESRMLHKLLDAERRLPPEPESELD